MTRLENPITGLQTSRRNLARMGAIVASAIIAKTTPAAADPFRCWMISSVGANIIDVGAKIAMLRAGRFHPTLIVF